MYEMFEAIAAANSEHELSACFMDAASPMFVAQGIGFYLIDAKGQLQAIKTQGLHDDFLWDYENFGREIDPVLGFITQRHAPVHNQMIMSTKTWVQTTYYQELCLRYNIEHILKAPIVGQGQLIGTLHLTRTQDLPAFNTTDLINLAAISTHISVRLANLQTLSSRSESPLNCLTQRELKIVNLVCQGPSNAKVAHELWITEHGVKQALCKSDLH
jgi:GAF domain-containing protein